MLIINKTFEFDQWLKKLKDLTAKAKILFRLQKLESDGHYGDWKSVGEGVLEMRILYGKGYRLYFKVQEEKVILLLIGGDKSSQEKDIQKAIQLAKKEKT
jgi:putative addiction module killer protein